MRKASLLAALIVAVVWIAPVDAQVNVTVNVAPPPPLVVAAPPPMVLVPGTRVYHVPSATFNLFVYGGQYYSFHNGVWFIGPSHNGPWRTIVVERVPRPVVAVPVKYYRIPPGHAKKMDDDDDRGRGRGHKDKGKKGRED